jgi:hypothetical protein
MAQKEAISKKANILPVKVQVAAAGKGCKENFAKVLYFSRKA